MGKSLTCAIEAVGRVLGLEAGHNLILVGAVDQPDDEDIIVNVMGWLALHK